MFGQQPFMDFTTVVEGYSEKDLKIAAENAAKKARQEAKEKADAGWQGVLNVWKEYATMLRIQKSALNDTILAMEQGKIELDPDVTDNYARQRKLELARKEGFDIEAAQKRHLSKKKKS